MCSRTSHDLRGTVPILVSVMLAFAVLPARAQILFPEILPPDATVVLSVPQTEGAWRAFESMRIIKAAEGFLKQPAADKGERPLTGTELFGGILSATELAIAPSKSASGTPVYLWVGKVKDQARLRQVIGKLEENATRQALSPNNPVTRTKEGIGDSMLVFLTDRQSTFGYFLNGPNSIWAFSNEPDTLRKTARRLAESASGSKGKASPSAFSEPLRAWHEMASATRSKEPFHVRFFFASASAENEGLLNGLEATGRQLGVHGLDPLLRKLRSQGATAGGIRFTPLAIQMESVSLFRENDQSLGARLYRSEQPMRALPGASFTVPEALIEGGNNLLDVPVMKQYLLAAIEGWQSAGDGSKTRLNQASQQARQRLTPLRNWASDPALYSELGPEWFFSLNDFAFLGPGEFPRVDLLVGLRTGDPEATQNGMRRLEAAIVDAAAQWSKEHPTTQTAPVAPPAFDEIREKTAKGEIAIRYLRSPRLPENLRPAWTVSNGFLLIDLSPETLAQAVRRAEAGAQTASSGLSTLQAETGMSSFHAYQIIRFHKASDILMSILQPIVRAMDPKSEPLVRRIGQILEPIDNVAFMRCGTPSGVRTVGEIRMPAQPQAGGR